MSETDWRTDRRDLYDIYPIINTLYDGYKEVDWYSVSNANFILLHKMSSILSNLLL